MAKKTPKPAKTAKPKKAAAPVVETVETEKPVRRFTPDSFRSRRKRTKANRTEVQKAKLPNAFKMMAQACGVLVRNWELFGGILLIYALLNLLLIGGLNGGNDVQDIKSSLGDLFTGKFAQLSAGLTLFTFLVTTGTGTMASGVTSAYQTVLLIMISLILIWCFRQVYGGVKIRVRDGFYNGVAPLIQFVLVMLFIALQLIPAVIGLFSFSELVVNGIVIVIWQQLIVSFVCLLLLLLSVYWLCSSLFALYIVTLPAMTPWKALKTARSVVRYRRASIFRKLLFIIPALFIPGALIMVPIVLFATVAAIPVFFVLSVLTVAVLHSYMYALYRELIS